MWGYDPYMFNMTNNYFTNLLGLRYKIRITSENPDLLIFSCFGSNHLRFSCKKLFFCGENTDSNPPARIIEPMIEYSNCSLSQFKSSETNKYFPLWVLFINWLYHEMPYELPSNPTYLVPFESLFVHGNKKTVPNKEFCIFLNNNPIKDRIELFESLSKIKKVDSFGKLLNNTGKVLRGSEKDKTDLLQRYRYTIAFENSYAQGYNTEKIIHPYTSNSIAIYNGGLDKKIFNSKSLFYLQDYADMGEMIADIQKHEENIDLYIQKLNQPLFQNNRIPSEFFPMSVLDWLINKLEL
tara:strand:+ start:29728 stop:30612 length:885 start_codon:yes stop_codon:yes gene_type:complete